MKRLCLLSVLTLLAACAQQEEPMLEPMVMEEPSLIDATQPLNCENGDDDDGIGGTGCTPGTVSIMAFR